MSSSKMKYKTTTDKRAEMIRNGSSLEEILEWAEQYKEIYPGAEIDKIKMNKKNGRA